MIYFLVGIALLAFLDTIRAILGPTATDRVVVVNAVSTKITIAILVLAYMYQDFVYIDVAIVFVLCGFVGTVAILRALIPHNQQELVSVITELPEELLKNREKVQKNG